jgi:hypothetical protein
VSLDLKDLRLKITPETDCVLRARARATGKDINELAREVLHEWAGAEIHSATVMVGLLTVEGLAGARQGVLRQHTQVTGPEK